jgi:hypothetical protein
MPEEAVSSSLSKVEWFTSVLESFLQKKPKGNQHLLTDLLLEDCSDMGVRGVCD